MTIRNSATVRQDLMDAVDGDGDFEIDVHMMARVLLNWMNENDCREMVDRQPEFYKGEMFGHLALFNDWHEDEDEDE